jgi:glyoxylase-like metal-dependent hydrolase (beta-lactamase superfamily II)
MSTDLTVLLEGIPVSCNQFNMGVANCILVQTADKKILFNTGPYSERLYLIFKMLELKIGADQIDMLVLSQIHYDTAMNVDMFPKAKVYVHKDELDFATTTPEADPAMPWFLGPLIRDLPNVQIITGEVDLAEGVKVVELPGQTAGSIGLLVGNTLLAGDAIPTVRCAKQKQIYPCYYSGELALTSLEKAMRMAEVIYPGHDRCFRTTDFKILSEVSMSLRLFFSPTGQDQEYVIKSEEQATFATWPAFAKLVADPLKP